MVCSVVNSPHSLQVCQIASEDHLAGFVPTLGDGGKSSGIDHELFMGLGHGYILIRQLGHWTKLGTVISNQ